MILNENVEKENSSSVVETEDESAGPRPWAAEQLYANTKVINNDDMFLMNELPFGCHFDTHKSTTPQQSNPAPSASAGVCLIDPPVPQGVRRFRRGGFTRYHCREFVFEFASRSERLLFQCLSPNSSVFTSSHFIRSNLTNRVAFRSYALSNGAKRMLAEENAGGASELSEAMSFELFHRVFNAQLYKTEMDIDYNFEQGKRTDYLVHMKIADEMRCIAVSVTRAMKYEGEFTLDDADYLLRKKLYGVLVSNGNVLDSDRWDKQILHIFCEQKYIADRLQEVFKQFQRDDPEFVDKTLVFVTVCHNANWIFTNRDEDKCNNKNKAKTDNKMKLVDEEQQNEQDKIPGKGNGYCRSCKQHLAIQLQIGADGDISPKPFSPLSSPSPLQPLGTFDYGDRYPSALCTECKVRQTMETLMAAMAIAAVHWQSHENARGMECDDNKIAAGGIDEKSNSVLMIVSRARASPERMRESSWPIGRGFMWRIEDDKKDWLDEKNAVDVDCKEKKIADHDASIHFQRSPSPFLSVLVDLHPSPSSSSGSSSLSPPTRVCCCYCHRFGHDSAICFQRIYDEGRRSGMESKAAEEMMTRKMEEMLGKMSEKTGRNIPKIVIKFEAAYQTRMRANAHENSS